MSDVIEAHGVRVAVPRGWEAELSLVHDDAGDADDRSRLESQGAESPRTLLHLANFALPPDRGDYGSGAVEIMDSGAILVVLTEFDRGSASTKLFSRVGLPSAVTVDDFSPHALQRRLPGQAGAQHFFRVGDRPFGLYVVLGSFRAASLLVPEVNRMVGGIAID